MGRMDNVGKIEFSFGPVIVEKPCSKCKEMLPLSEFRQRTGSDKRLGHIRRTRLMPWLTSGPGQPIDRSSDSA
jgi:hypothetical protein